MREIGLSLNNQPLTFTYEIGEEVKKSIHTGSHQPENLLRMHSTTDFSWYCTASYLSKKGFHHQPLHSKPYKLTVNGISKILWTVTITNISFSVVQNSDNEFNSSSMLVIHSNNLLKIYNIIRTITLINLFLNIGRLINV